MRGVLRRDLPLHDSAIGFADHADRARAPGLGGAPLDHPITVETLVLRVHVGAEARGAAGAAYIILHDNIAPFHEIGNDERITVERASRRGAKATIGIVLEDGRELPRGIGARNPYIEFDAVAHCNPDARRDLHAVLTAVLV